MPIHAPSETIHALGSGLLPNCESRSLFKDRFALPQAKDEKEKTPRKDWFNSLINRHAAKTPQRHWLPSNTESIHARLMSRLMVDLSGGVMDNADLNLDRYGLPSIPGSAVKGLARRMALQALHDWFSAQPEKGSTEPIDPDDACAPCCNNFTTPAEMLAAIARIFGWTPDDWKSDKKDGLYKSDFAWACHGGKNLITAARALLPPHETSAGTIAFLPASPNTDPGLELDVLTPHHTKYHAGEKNYENAPDTEDPVPVFFPAVKPQRETDYFTFPLIPLRRTQTDDLRHAKTFLTQGLELLGIGAKTNVGYGWFEINTRAAQAIALEKKQSDDASAVADQEPCAVILAELEELPEPQLAGILNKYSFDQRFWPQDKPALYEFTLLRHILDARPQLAESKKGKKAVQQLAEKYNQPLS